MSTVIQLSRPFTHGGRHIDRITLRRPIVRDIRGMDRVAGSQMEKVVWLLTQLAELSFDEVDLIDGQDLVRIGEVVEGFMQQGAS